MWKGVYPGNFILWHQYKSWRLVRYAASFEPDFFQVVRCFGRIDDGLPFVIDHRFHRSSECTSRSMSGLAD
jgi:hypothetical protein